MACLKFFRIIDIKAWGMGVNKIEPILDCMDRADPDICLSATQYSVLEHEDA